MSTAPDALALRLPFSLEIPISAAIAAAVVWLALDLLGRGPRPRSLGRALLHRSRLSLALTILVAGLGWWLALLLSPGVLPFLSDEREVRDLVVAAGVIWTLLRCKKELVGQADRYSAELFPALPARDRLFLFDLADKLIATLVVVIGAVELLRLLGTPASLLAVAGGFGAAALGFGARTVVENVLSAISLYINRPFVVGDQIQLPGEKLSGTVEQIGWFHTQLRDAERQPVFLPNGLFLSRPVINAGRIDRRRVWIDFGLRYEDRQAVEPILADLRRELAEDPAIDHAKPQAVHVLGYGANGLELRLLCFSADADLEAAWELRQRWLLRIARVLESHHAEMPYERNAPPPT